MLRDFVVYTTISTQARSLESTVKIMEPFSHPSEKVVAAVEASKKKKIT